MTAILILALIIVLILWLTGKKKLQQIISDLTSRLETSEKKYQDLENEHTSLTDKYSKLSKYEGLLDIEEKANEILSNADKTANELTIKAQEELNKAIEDANFKRQIASEEVEKLKKQSELLFSTAKSDADKIIEEANRKAEEVAGEAMKALNNQKELEKTAKAMKNIIEGYGDQYLVPTFSLLDDLADEFGHTEAGVKLKDSREYTRKLN